MRPPAHVSLDSMMEYALKGSHDWRSLISIYIVLRFDFATCKQGSIAEKRIPPLRERQALMVRNMISNHTDTRHLRFADYSKPIHEDGGPLAGNIKKVVSFA